MAQSTELVVKSNYTFALFLSDMDDSTYDAAVLVGEDNTRVSVPKILLVAASNFLEQGMCDMCGCEDTVIFLPGFKAETLYMFAEYIRGRQVYGNVEMLPELYDLCGTLGVPLLDSDVIYESPVKEEPEEPEDPIDTDWLQLNEEMSFKTEPIPCEVISVNGGKLRDIRPKVVSSETYILPTIQNVRSLDNGVVRSGCKVYECTLCQKRFTQKASLNAHMHAHLGVKPYKCTLCQKSFTLKCNLTAHMRTHSGVKPYECSICQRRFTGKTVLTHHINTHAGVRPHKCPVCERSFTQKATLKTHMKNVHSGTKPYECEVCKRRFSDKAKYETHLFHHEVRK